MRVSGINQGDTPISVSIALDDRICFNECALYFHVSSPMTTSCVFDSLSTGLDGTTNFLLAEAVRGLTFIRDSADVQILKSVLPYVITNLTGLLMPRLGNKRNLSHEGTYPDGAGRTEYPRGSRRRFVDGGRGRGGRGRVRF